MKTILAAFILSLSMNSFGATQLDDLIRGEMSAVKTYDQVIAKIKDEKEVEKLKAIRDNHQNAVDKLKTHASKDVKEDAQSTGVWGTFTKAWTGGAKLFGDNAALKALSQGEEHGIREYKEALNDENVRPEVKQMIRTQFLPKQEKHLETLKTFM